MQQPVTAEYAAAGRVGLAALSDRQRQLLQRHLPLVALVLRRSPVGRAAGTCGPDRADLFQEGALALADALRSHDPGRHGDFAAFAMARIRHRVSQHACETSGVVRVPYITQRRRRGALGDRRHRPDAPPRAIPDPEPASRCPWRHRNVHDAHAPDGEAAESCDATLGELIRRRYDLAAQRAWRKLAVATRARPAARAVLERCLHERWMVPEPEARTALRQIARELNCSLGRVTRCDGKVRAALAAELSADAVFNEMLARARRAPHGFDQRVETGEPASAPTTSSAPCAPDHVWDG